MWGREAGYILHGVDVGAGCLWEEKRISQCHFFSMDLCLRGYEVCCLLGLALEAPTRNGPKG
jgi:hypothetical protein